MAAFRSAYDRRAGVYHFISDNYGGSLHSYPLYDGYKSTKVLFLSGLWGRILAQSCQIQAAL